MSYLIIVFIKDKLVGISTSIPLQSISEVLVGAIELFKARGLNLDEIYYYDEVILNPTLRAIGIVNEIYSLQDTFASNTDFKKIAIATVERSIDDLRTPIGYKEPSKMWERLGFEKTNIKVQWRWPTIQNDKTVKTVDNKMVYWLKDITT